MFEFRRAIWPLFEWASDPSNYSQGVEGFLDHVVLLDFGDFNKVVAGTTGHPVSVLQRGGDSPPTRELDDDLLRDVDTLIVVSLDHLRTKQRASQGEIECIRSFLRREEVCLIVCPHHDVGATDVVQEREVQFVHHGDRLVPPQQRIGGFARSLLEALGFPIENRFGLSPGRAHDGSPEPLLWPEGDSKGTLLDGVTTFNLHPHLPHLWVPPDLSAKVATLAQQAINISAPPHPFSLEGNRYFNAFLHIPPEGKRSGQIFVCDVTLWSSAFGGLASLHKLWRNVATL